MNKSEVTITMIQTKNNKILEQVRIPNHRKSKAINIFNDVCVKDKHITNKQLIDGIKKRDSLAIIKYAFQRDD